MLGNEEEKLEIVFSAAMYVIYWINTTYLVNVGVADIDPNIIK